MKNRINFSQWNTPSQSLAEGAGTSSGKIHKLNPDNPKDPEVQVFGVGIYTLSSLKKNAANKIKDLAIRAKRGDFELVFKQIDEESSILRHMVRAIVDVEKELNSPGIKRKLTRMKRKTNENV